MRKSYLFILFIIGGLLLGCEPKIDDFEPDAGTTNLSVYIALGSGMTAGFADGDLYRDMQHHSLGNILAGQFATAGGGGFKQPLMFDNLGFGKRMVLGFKADCLGQTSLSPVGVQGTPDPQNFGSIAAQGPYQNMGVPGARLLHMLIPGYAAFNPYYARFASSPATSSILADAAAQSPSFFTLWAGIEDAVWFAKDGGMNVGDSLTPVPLFTAYLNNILMAIMANGAKGAIANIPDILSLPYFTTVPYNGLVLTTETQVAMLNAAYGPYGLTFALGPNPWVIQDINAITGFRQVKEDEMILLSIPQDSLKCAGWGTLKPIPHNYVLDKEEILQTRASINAYNAVIREAAQALGLAYVDVHLMLKNAEAGITFDAVTMNTRFVSGGLFSLDGLHLNAKGNAIVANLFIEAINSKFNASIPKVNVHDYPGVAFP